MIPMTLWMKNFLRASVFAKADGRMASVTSAVADFLKTGLTRLAHAAAGVTCGGARKRIIRFESTDEILTRHNRVPTRPEAQPVSGLVSRPPLDRHCAGPAGEAGIPPAFYPPRSKQVIRVFAGRGGKMALASTINGALLRELPRRRAGWRGPSQGSRQGRPDGAGDDCHTSENHPESFRPGFEPG